MGLLAGQQLLGLGEVGQADQPELRLRLELGIDQFGLHLGTAAQPPVDLDVAHLRLELVAAPQPERDGRDHHADHRDDRPKTLDDDAEVGDVQELQDDREAPRSAAR